MFSLLFRWIKKFKWSFVKNFRQQDSLVFWLSKKSVSKFLLKIKS